MKRVLFVNGCIRGKDISRSYQLAQAFLAPFSEKGFLVEEVELGALCPSYLHYGNFAAREEKIAAGNFDDPLFDLARQFVSADVLLFAAPFWEYSFPAVVKAYIEQVSVCGMAFHYTPQGVEGLCRAKALVFCTTRGGFATGESAHLEQGGRYLKAMCEMYGIDKMEMVAAEGLDVDGMDVEAAMEKAKAEAKETAQTICRLFEKEDGYRK